MAGGQFEFSTPLPEGNGVFLSARKPGFLVEPDENNMLQALAGQEVTIALIPEGVIAGRVTLGGSEAGFRVNVQIFLRQVENGLLRWQMRGSAQTNSNGEFRFAELLPGAYKITTSELADRDPVALVPGGQNYAYPPIYFPNATDFDAASHDSVGCGADFSGRPVAHSESLLSGGNPDRKCRCFGGNEHLGVAKRPESSGIFP